MVGNVVNVILDGPYAHSPFCVFPAFNYTFHLGTYPPGGYTVNVFHRYQHFFGYTATELVGSTSFTVTAVHHPIPASSGATTLILLLTVALAGILTVNTSASRSACP